MTIRISQPALATPDRSFRRKMSAKRPMKIQINMNQKKNATSDQIASQNVKLDVPTELHAASRTVIAASNGTTGRPMSCLTVESMVIRSS